jgi:hypothetical protein
VPELEIALLAKAQKYKRMYGKDCINQIDALVYVDLEERFLAVNSRIPALDRLKSQGWRSISLLFSPYGVVLWANPTAPEFLRATPPGPHIEWRDIDTLFKLTD